MRCDIFHHDVLNIVCVSLGVVASQRRIQMAGSTLLNGTIDAPKVLECGDSSPLLVRRSEPPHKRRAAVNRRISKDNRAKREYVWWIMPQDHGSLSRSDRIAFATTYIGAGECRYRMKCRLANT
jgi:hypothetical protein